MAKSKLTETEVKEIERQVAAESAISEAKRILRVKFDRSIPFDQNALRVERINPDGTAVVSTEDKYCLIIHNGDFDKDGVEVCVVFSDFEPIDTAMMFARGWNSDNGSRYIGFKKSAWAEVLTYEEYYIRENGGKMRVKPQPKRGKRGKATVKLAKVG